MMDRIARGLRMVMPDRIDAFAYLWLTGSVVVLANIPTLLVRLGFTSYNNHLAAMLDGTVAQWVGWLDSVQATKTIVTFLLWGSVGFVVFIIFQIVLRAFTSVYEESVFITRYIRPPSSSQRNYLLFLLLGSLEFLATTLLLLLVTMLTILQCLPSAVVYVESAIVSGSLTHIGLATLWVALLWGGICMIHAAISLMAHRHRILNAS